MVIHQAILKQYIFVRQRVDFYIEDLTDPFIVSQEQRLNTFSEDCVIREKSDRFWCELMHAGLDMNMKHPAYT